MEKAYIDPMGTMACALNGQTLNIAKHKEVWAKTKNGDRAFPVSKIEDYSCEIFYHILVYDYEGKKYDFVQLTDKSADELVNVVIDILY